MLNADIINGGGVVVVTIYDYDATTNQQICVECGATIDNTQVLVS